MKQASQKANAEASNGLEDQETMKQVVPMSFKEFLVAMIHNDKAAAQLADEIGLTGE